MRSVLTTAIFGCLFGSAAQADEKPNSKSVRKIVVFQLNYTTADKAAARLERMLSKTVKLKTGGTGIVPRSPVTVIPDSRVNVLLVFAAPQLATKVRSMVHDIERRGLAKEMELIPYWHGDSNLKSLDLSKIVQDWQKERTIQRLNEEEIRILDSLDKTVSFQVQRVTLKAAISEIATKADLNIVVDTKGLRDVGLSMQSPVTFSARQTPLRSALTKFLSKLQLGFDIEDEVLKITSRSRLNDGYFLKEYPVADLIAGVKDGKAVIDFDSLVRRIQSDITPGSWREGKADISRVESRLSLAIRQTRAGHSRVGKLLTKIREERRADGRLPGRVR